MTTDFPPAIAALLDDNRRYAAEQHDPRTPAPPRKGLLVVTCMDTRIVAQTVLGLVSGDAHILRNAGGRVTEDVLRSLAVSCGVYGTRDVAVIHHTDCGMLLPADTLRGKIEEASGRPVEDLDLRVIADAKTALETDVETVRSSPLVPDDVRVWGLRYDMASGLLDLEHRASALPG